jgi:hypothetical protein
MVARVRIEMEQEYRNCKQWPDVSYIAQNLGLITIKRALVSVHLKFCWYQCLTGQDVLNWHKYVLIVLNFRNNIFPSGHFQITVPCLPQCKMMPQIKDIGEGKIYLSESKTTLIISCVMR